MHCITYEHIASSDKIPEEVIYVKPSMDAIQQLQRQSADNSRSLCYDYLARSPSNKHVDRAGRR
jgi:hypothetical protein